MSSLSNKQHITQEDLLRYVEDDCSRTEMRDIDRHLATCPMCSNAVEGLMLLSEPSAAVAQLDKRVDEKIAEKILAQPIGTPVDLPIEKPILQVVKRPFWQQRWAVAAAVLLLASGSIWVYKNTEKAEKQAIASAEIQAMPNSELSNNAVAITLDSLNQTPQYAEAKTTKKDEIVLDLRPSSGIANTAVAPVQQETKRKTINTANSPTFQKTDIATTDIATIKDKIDAEKDAPRTASTSAPAPAAYSTQMDKTEENVVVPAQKAPQTPYSMSSKAKTKEVKSEDVDNESKQSATKNRDAIVVGSAKAKKPMPAAAKTTPSVSTASEPLLSRADDHFNNKNYQAATAEYAQFVAQETEGEKYEHALFQLANCYLKLNKKADAKILFEKLSGTNGQYQRAAKKALKDL